MWPGLSVLSPHRTSSPAYAHSDQYYLHHTTLSTVVHICMASVFCHFSIWSYIAMHWNWSLWSWTAYGKVHSPFIFGEIVFQNCTETVTQRKRMAMFIHTSNPCNHIQLPVYHSQSQSITSWLSGIVPVSKEIQYPTSCFIVSIANDKMEFDTYTMKLPPKPRLRL